ncbi:LAFA_0F21374g1_1 [Lachancea sp. 'fantastica']|nr:LAFA_0F21374g1_1 [Lachancea sp. 'fantastica']
MIILEEKSMSQPVSKNTKEENAMASLLDLPIEVAKMILEQLASNPKTSVMDYYNWLKVIGGSSALISGLLREKVHVVNLGKSTSDFVQMISGSKVFGDPKDVIPRHVNHVVIAADEEFLDGQTTPDMPQPYGTMKVYLAYHYTGNRINLKEVHSKYVDKFPFGCLRPNHIIAIAKDSLELYIEKDDGNMFDPDFYPGALPVFMNITFFNARHFFIHHRCLSDFAQMRQGNFRWSRLDKHGVVFERLGKIYRENDELYPVEKKTKTEQYTSNGYQRERQVEVIDRGGYEEVSSELALLMGKSYMNAYFCISMSCPQLEAVSFFKEKADETDPHLNTIDLYRFLKSSSDVTLQKFLNLHSLRNWHLPSIRAFSGHNLLWYRENESRATKYADAKSLIPMIRDRVRRESPDGLPHVNAQILPEGVINTKVTNWVPLDVDFVSNMKKNTSPLICLRQPCLKSLELGLLVSKPEGSLTVEGLYLPQLGKLGLSFDTDLVHKSVRNPMFNITFSEWNDLRGCRIFNCELDQAYEGHINLLVSNLRSALPSLDSKKGFKGLQKQESISFANKDFVLDGLEKIEMSIND